MSLHLTFNDGTKNVTIDIPGTSYPSGTATSGADKMYVQLPAGWTIVDGTGTASNPQRDSFNVTHVCRSGGGNGGGGNGRRHRSARRTPSPAGCGLPGLSAIRVPVG